MFLLRRVLERAAGIILAAFLLLICLSFTASASEPATVIGDTVRLREDASTSASVVTVLSDGDALDVLDASIDGWYQVSYTDEDGVSCTGYVSRDYVSLSSDQPQTTDTGVTRTATVLENGVRVRSEASTEASILAQLPEGSVVAIVDDATEGWIRVSCSDDDSSYLGYISSDFLSFNAVAYGSTADAAVLRTEADSAAQAVAALDAGAQVDILDEADGWYQVLYTDENGDSCTGYVEQALIIADGSDECIGYGTVTTDGLCLRSEPSADASALAKLSEGVTFQITSDETEGWYGITYDGKNGYVSAEFVTVSDSIDTGYIQVTATSLALRSGTSPDLATMTYIPEGTLLTVSGSSGSWYLVSYDGFTGYVSGEYVSATTENGYQTASSGSSGSSSSSSTITSTGTSSTGSAVASYAIQFLGNPYVWGGTSLTNGCDCSGFVMQVFAHFGVSLPHSSSAIRSYGSSVSLSEIQPGDIVCYSGHVGIYVGNGKIISALGSKYGITYSSVTYSSIITIRRIFS